ncbi:putative pectinesterase [Iris pallida]|uniref:Pectinesterase n=1 Tax=Iris pallida TaxID=29817 RepID=A0AAX6FUJ3_IRIPA|nr:putative pectinesterase [Iris pallida]
MASSPYESLLSSSTTTHRIRSSSLPCKALLLTLSLATVICLTSFVTIHFTTSPTYSSASLCSTSPEPSACHAAVSDILTLSSAPKSTPVRVLNSLISKSLLQIDSFTYELDRANNNLMNSQPVSDCAQLMDLSRDRLVESMGSVSAGAHTDARTFLSAVLTNHATCLDGLAGPARSALEPQLKLLMSSASASLAVLNSVDESPARRHGDVEHTRAAVGEFPSWMSFRDRKLLEASGNAVTANVVVAKDGSGKYKTVQAAVDSAPDKGTSRYVIYVKKGVYTENVVMTKKKTNVMIVGDGMDATVLTGSLNVVDGNTTFNSATLACNGDGLILQDLKVENTAGPAKHQAVALRVSADRSAINRCKIEAYQDTLYAHNFRQFYRDSNVSGTVDFIFGNAAVVLQNCNLVARKPMANQKNLVTAQGRIDPNQNTGTSIQNCQIVPAADLVPVEGSIKSYLGRPWKLYSRTVVMQSFIDTHRSQGVAGVGRGFRAQHLVYGEYKNRGPGAGTAGRVKWPGYKVITDAKLANSFTVAGLIQGGSWLSSTGVTFTEGL